MAKYYIQSGDINFVVQAADAESAALWVLNQTINRTDSSSDIAINTGESRLDSNERLVCQAVLALDQFDNEILVSQIGFGRSESGLYDTELMFKQWCELLYAMSNLFDQL